MNYQGDNTSAEVDLVILRGEIRHEMEKWYLTTFGDINKLLKLRKLFLEKFGAEALNEITLTVQAEITEKQRKEVCDVVARADERTYRRNVSRNRLKTRTGGQQHSSRRKSHQSKRVATRHRHRNFR